MLINALVAVGEGKIMKAIRKAPVTFGYMELHQNQEKAVRVFVRGSNDRLCLNASAFVKNHVILMCIAIITFQRAKQKVTIRNFSCRKICMACETRLHNA